jgi:hypothetical protein
MIKQKQREVNHFQASPTLPKIVAQKPLMGYLIQK